MIAHATSNGRGSSWTRTSVLTAAMVLPCLPALAQRQTAVDEDMERYERETWRMSLSLDSPNLKPPAVQFAVFDRDPVPGFEAAVKKYRTYHHDQIEGAENKAKKPVARSSFMRITWDRGFRQITGDQLYLLEPDGFHGVSSNGPGGTKWIATKVATVGGKPACWCIPVQVKTGKQIQVTFTENNMLDLESVFGNAMREADP